MYRDIMSGSQEKRPLLGNGLKHVSAATGTLGTTGQIIGNDVFYEVRAELT
jgi:hypothetical protein